MLFRDGGLVDVGVMGTMSGGGGGGGGAGAGATLCRFLALTPAAASTVGATCVCASCSNVEGKNTFSSELKDPL